MLEGPGVDGTSDRALDGNPARTPPIPPETAPPKKRRSFAWVWLLLFAALAYGGYRYYQASKQRQQAADKSQAARMAPRSVPVVAVLSHLGDMPIYLRGLGSVTPFNTVAVKSRVDGQLIAIHFQEGQFVKKGDLMAEIDPRPFQVQLDQAQGMLARDTAQLNDAKANLARYQALWQEKVIAKQQLDTQAASVGQFEGTLEADRAAINNVKLQLSFTKITAPLSGRVGLRLIDVGNMVHASDPNGLVVIDQLQPIAALFTIPADNLPPVLAHLRSGRKLPVEAYDRDDKNKLATGTLLTVDNQIDPATGTSRLKAVFPNTDGALFPNQFVNCRMLLDTKTGVVIVPVPAVQRGPQGSYVYVVKRDKSAAVRLVTVGITEGNNVVIDKGLAANELVIVDGQDKLQDGSKVDVRTANGSPAGGAPRRRVKK
ncbi:MAG: MdtA/MuxA family multidrug efflux RND transporter periplasmic adaptor subunit [Acidobacteriota bacterium]|nr:MdtA/MuxA family multidrug efflux RND transporter periplasmic adaptor subunit [Acidobacteriota bacterium]